MRRLLATLLVALAPACLQAAEVRVLTAGAFKQVLLAAQPDIEKRTGHRLSIDNDTAGGLQRRIAAGEVFDVVISTPASLQPVESRLVQAPRPLARVGIGVAVRQGDPLPDIGSVQAFRTLVERTRAIAMVDPAAGGTSGVYLFRLYSQWGIADQVKAKAVLVPGGLSAEKLLTRDADVAVQQMSELLAVPGVQVVGPLPAEIQVYTVYAGAISTQAPQAEAAAAVLKLLHDPGLEPVLKAKGMDKP